jgi:hypothetical protein
MMKISIIQLLHNITFGIGRYTHNQKDKEKKKDPPR